MNYFKIFLLTILTSLFIGCQIEYPVCVIMSSSHSISEKKIELKKVFGGTAEVTGFINPLFLPIKLSYSSSNGFNIISEGQISAPTPIGTVGLEYSFGSQRLTKINGYEITGGDYVLGLVDKEKNENQLFKIEGYNRLQVISSGETKIDAQEGYIEIDITKADIQEFAFIDNSKVALVNNTNKTVNYTFTAIDMASNRESYSCSIEPNSYRYFPRFSMAKKIGSALNSNFSFSIETMDKIGNKKTIMAEKVRYGEAYHITDAAGSLELLKSQSIY